MIYLSYLKLSWYFGLFSNFFNGRNLPLNVLVTSCPVNTYSPINIVVNCWPFKAANSEMLTTLRIFPIPVSKNIVTEIDGA